MAGRPGHNPLESQTITRPRFGQTVGTIVNQRHADVAVGIVLVGIVLVGVLTAVQFATAGGPMGDGSGGIMPLAGPVIGSLVMASLVGAAYVVVRSHVFDGRTGDERPAGEPGVSTDSPEAGARSHTATGPGDRATGQAAADRQLLAILPEDERKILEPVLDTPGLTQIALRDRSGFSKSKISQTVTDLEERGLLYRERQGRTYRVYPAEEIEDRV